MLSMREFFLENIGKIVYIKTILDEVYEGKLLRVDTDFITVDDSENESVTPNIVLSHIVLFQISDIEEDGEEQEEDKNNESQSRVVDSKKFI